MGKVISIMPDFGLGAYAWMKEEGDPPFPQVGGNIADSVSWGAKDIPISDELHQELGNWALKFESECDDTDFDWEAFHEKGRALAKRLKGEIGDQAKVYYVKAWEDPNHEENEEILIRNTLA